MALYRYLLAAAFAAGTLSVPAIAQLDAPPDAKDETRAAEQRESGEAAPTTPPELGVVVTDSPGDGVLVTRVLRGGPAARAGIRPGDFILSVAGKAIGTPAELCQAVRAADPESDLAIGFWREGTGLSANVSLASKFSDSIRQKAWLGVALEVTEGARILVADVVPASPAFQGGIRVGDVIVRIDAEKIDSVDEVLKLMERIKTGDNVDLTVLRDGEERTFTVRVGSAMQQTKRWLDEWWPRVEVEGPWTEFVPRNVDVDGYLEYFEETIDQLGEEVRALRGQLRQRGPEREPLPREEREDNEPSQGDQRSGAPESSAANATTTLLVYQPVRSYRNFRGGRPGVQYRYTYPRRSSYRRDYYAPPTVRYFYPAPPPYYPYYAPPPYYPYYGGPGIYIGPTWYYYW